MFQKRQTMARQHNKNKIKWNIVSRSFVSSDFLSLNQSQINNDINAKNAYFSEYLGYERRNFFNFLKYNIFLTYYANLFFIII